jgi:outer membrane protein OmpA-like peptidoglycan-associated protein
MDIGEEILLMKRLIFTAFAGSSLLLGYGQGLVVNGNFEDRNNCVEFLSGCAPEAWFRFPYVKLQPSNNARVAEGMHHETLVMEHRTKGISGRTFLYTRLVCPTEPGKTYRFKVAVFTNGHAYDHLDLVLSKYEPQRNISSILSGKSTSYRLTLTRPSPYVNDWREASVVFKATGEERYLLLGNIAKQPMPFTRNYRYDDPLILYDIDSVSLMPSDGKWLPCEGLAEEKKILYLNNYRHTDFNYLDDEPLYVPDTITAVVAPPAKVVGLSPPTQTITDTLLIPDVLFDFDKGTLNKKLLYQMDDIIQIIKKKKFRTIEVVGHTDDRGSITYNEQLSELRARSVAKYLMDQLQMSSELLTIRRMAASTPIAPNTTNEGRRKNRRVEIILIQ